MSVILNVAYPAEMFRFRRVLRLNSFEFRHVLIIFGCAAAMDARLGFGTRLRWFCDRGVW